MSKKILIINGPNLNLLGTREPQIYGAETLVELNERISKHASALGLETEFYQSNVEGELVNFVQLAASGAAAGIVINPAAYTHTSAALGDAISGVGVPTVEVHISNIFAREEFRHNSYISPVAVGTICGLGSDGYLLAVTALAERLKS